MKLKKCFHTLIIAYDLRMELYNCLVIAYYVVYAQLLHITIHECMHYMASFMRLDMIQFMFRLSLLSLQLIPFLFPLLPICRYQVRFLQKTYHPFWVQLAQTQCLYHVVHIYLQQLVYATNTFFDIQIHLGIILRVEACSHRLL